MDIETFTVEGSGPQCTSSECVRKPLQPRGDDTNSMQMSYITGDVLPTIAQEQLHDRLQGISHCLRLLGTGRSTAAPCGQLLVGIRFKAIDQGLYIMLVPPPSPLPVSIKGGGGHQHNMKTDVLFRKLCRSHNSCREKLMTQIRRLPMREPRPA